MAAELLYFANPMCSWCWGFAPVLQQLKTSYPDLNITVATGTLGAERASRPMRQKDKDYVRGHWEHVIEKTGQRFDFSFFDRDEFTYDTEPPSRALALLRRQYPALSVAFLHRLQETFYASNLDITSIDVLRDLASEFGIERDHFDQTFEDGSLKQEIQLEWRQTAQLGISGYPTILVLQDQKAHVLTIGYRPYEAIQLTLDQYVNKVA